MADGQVSQQNGPKSPRFRTEPSTRAEHLFRTGRIGRALRLLRIEQMANALGIEQNVVLRLYGPIPTPDPPESIVYLLAHTIPPVDGDPVKIGYTRNIIRRLDDLQAGSVKKLWLISYLEGGKALEAELHERLFLWQIREDWFEMCQDVRDEFSARMGRAA